MSALLSAEDIATLKSLIDWWDEAGVEALPVAPAPPAKTPRAARNEPAPAPRNATMTQPAASTAPFGGSSAADPRTLAQAAHDLDALRTALEGFEGCALKASATRLVFARGNPAARVMVVGEAPGRDEDEQGKPFVGRAGQLLDRMLAAIGLDETSAYITNAVFWRPPGNGKPSEEDLEICRPFAERHIELVRPDFLVLAGGASTQTLLRERNGIVSVRGKWRDFTLPDGATIPTLPMFHPAFLLRRPQEKAKAWADLLSLRERLNG